MSIWLTVEVEVLHEMLDVVGIWFFSHGSQDGHHLLSGDHAVRILVKKQKTLKKIYNRQKKTEF